MKLDCYPPTHVQASYPSLHFHITFTMTTEMALINVPTDPSENVSVNAEQSLITDGGENQDESSQDQEAPLGFSLHIPDSPVQTTDGTQDRTQEWDNQTTKLSWHALVDVFDRSSKEIKAIYNVLLDCGAVDERNPLPRSPSSAAEVLAKLETAGTRLQNVTALLTKAIRLNSELHPHYSYQGGVEFFFDMWGEKWSRESFPENFNPCYLDFREIRESSRGLEAAHPRLGRSIAGFPKEWTDDSRTGELQDVALTTRQHAEQTLEGCVQFSMAYSDKRKRWFTQDGIVPSTAHGIWELFEALESDLTLSLARERAR